MKLRSRKKAASASRYGGPAGTGRPARLRAAQCTPAPPRANKPPWTCFNLRLGHRGWSCHINFPSQEVLGATPAAHDRLKPPCSRSGGPDSQQSRCRGGAPTTDGLVSGCTPGEVETLLPSAPSQWPGLFGDAQIRVGRNGRIFHRALPTKNATHGGPPSLLTLSRVEQLIVLSQCQELSSRPPRHHQRDPM